ncbi:hypothetical protein KX199_004621 [Salmonella enterica]|nr:hypothetical protein [Salmonella enterica]
MTTLVIVESPNKVSKISTILGDGYKVMATVADAPLMQLAGPGLRFAAVLAVVIFAPRVFDAALRRIATRRA